MAASPAAAAAATTAAAASSSAAPAAAAPAAAPAQAANAPWYGTIADAELATWAQTKNFADPATALAAFRNTEKFVGVPADQIIRKPKDANDAEGLKAYRAALGVPEAPDKYELPVAEGQDPKFADWARGAFHKHGVPGEIAKGIATDWNGWLEGQVKAAEEADKLAIAAADTQLKNDWGTQYGANKELATRAFTTFAEQAGLTDAVAHLDTVMGVPAVAKLFHAIGKAVGEGKFVGGPPSAMTMTPESAQQKIQQLRADPDWSKAYLAGDRNKQLEYQQLLAIVTGDTSGVSALQSRR
jgi:hypothetical protein